MSKALFKVGKLRELLPHRYPMLMLDRVVELGEKHVIAEKLVSQNEPFFTGHFPDAPVLPGVLILEAMAQAGGVWAVVKVEGNKGLTTALAGIDKARFRKPVVPGDTLVLHVEVIQSRGKVLKLQGIARVDGEIVAEARVLAAFVDWSDEI